MPAKRQCSTHDMDNEILTSKSTAARVTKSQPQAKSTKATNPAKPSIVVAGKDEPTYDALGYEIDPVKVAKANRRPRRPTSAMYMKKLDDKRREQLRKEEIMGTCHDQISALTLMAWDDRVARELGKPYHKVVMEDFEEVYRRGIRFHPDEFLANKMSETEKDRISKLCIGSAFRK